MKTLKQKMSAGEVVLGTMLSELSSPNLVRILKTAGFEFIVVDCEHGYFDFSQLANIVSVGNGFNLPIIVRIPFIEREFITKVLDMGGDGLLSPMVNTVEDAECLVRFAKYPPLGKRGISTTRAHTDYNPPPLSEYLPLANQRTMVLAQIETKEAVGNAAAIAAVEGVDAVIVGPNDLAGDLGTPGRLDTPEMDAAVGAVVEAARSAGKACGIIDSKVPFLHKWRDRGMNVFSCGSEVGMVMKAAHGTIAEFRG